MKSLARTFRQSNLRLRPRRQFLERPSADALLPRSYLNDRNFSRWTGRRSEDFLRTSSPKLEQMYQYIGQHGAPRSEYQEFLVFASKGAIAGVLLYWFFTDGNLPIFPDINKMDVPQREYVKYKMVQRYNRLVIKLFDVMLKIPQWTQTKIVDIMNYIKEHKD